MLTHFGHISRHLGYTEKLLKKGLFSTGLDLSRIAKIELLQESAVLGALGALTHADPFWSHFSTFGLHRAALKKMPLLDRSGPVTNRQNCTFARKCSFGSPREP